jgi:hypothetical protein
MSCHGHSGYFNISINGKNLWGKFMGKIYGENLWGKLMGKINGENLFMKRINDTFQHWQLIE